MNDMTQDLGRHGRTLPRFWCPAEFWPALGCESAARFVGIWWEMVGDEAAWGDGRTTTVGASWLAYLTLMEHNWPGHSDEDAQGVGSSETVATHWLVVDRSAAEGAWLVAADVASELLRRQWPEEPVADAAADGVGQLSFEELLGLVETLPAGRAVSAEEIGRRMAEDARRIEELVAALVGGGRARVK